ncbi:MAG: hypothetical protein NTY09_11115 [bacterium]|nr:hypothetical protein [bacterium]
MESIAVNDIVLGIVGETEFEAGYALLQNHPISWEDDVDWSITVRSLDADLGMSDGGLYTKLLSDLQWKLSTESVWIPMTQSDTEVDSDVAGSGVIYIDIKVLLDWVQDAPGSYQADLEFTIAPV